MQRLRQPRFLLSPALGCDEGCPRLKKHCSEESGSLASISLKSSKACLFAFFALALVWRRPGSSVEPKPNIVFPVVNPSEGWFTLYFLSLKDFELSNQVEGTRLHSLSKRRVSGGIRMFLPSRKVITRRLLRNRLGLQFHPLQLSFHCWLRKDSAFFSRCLSSGNGRAWWSSKSSFSCSSISLPAGVSCFRGVEKSATPCDGEIWTRAG